MPQLPKNEAGQLQRLLSTRQAGQYLGVHPSTIRRLVYSGELPVVRCFKFFRIDKADLDEFVSARKDVL